VSFHKHPLMKDARNENPSGFVPVEDNMAAVLHPPQAWANIITRTAKSRIVSQPLAASFKIVNITDGLVFAPGA